MSKKNNMLKIITLSQLTFTNVMGFLFYSPRSLFIVRLKKSDLFLSLFRFN